MMLGNFSVGMLFYAAFKKDLQLVTLRQMLASRFAQGIYRRRGLDIGRV
jgi:hypothetical protein